MEKTCEVCGRRMEPRRRWKETAGEVRYCSDACRKRKLRPVDTRLEEAILELLGKRGAGKSI